MTSREPFFESVRPEPEEPEPQRTFANMPWNPPINVVPVSVLAEADLFVSDMVVLRLHIIRAYDRGVLFEVEGWLHPDVAERAEGHYGMQNEPRMGLLLTDGTKLGAQLPGHSPDTAPASTGTLSMTLSGGQSGELRLTQQWWVQPVPAVDAAVVVSWDDLDVPETFTPVDLSPVREASTHARELWPIPDVEEGYGWFAYSPTSGAVDASRLAMPPDVEDGGGGGYTDDDHPQ